MPNDETAFILEEYLNTWSEHGIETTPGLRTALFRCWGDGGAAGAPLRCPSAKVTVAEAPSGPRSLSEVRAWLGDCTRCKLCEGRKQIVFGIGDAHAKLMF